MNDEKNLPAPPPPPKTASSQATPQQKPFAPKPPIKTDKGFLATPQQQQQHDASRLSPTRVASPAPSVTSISTHGSEDSSGAGSPIRPVSPRTVEISHAVAPVAMQAITQNNDYLSTTNSHTTKPLPRTSSSANDQKPPAAAPLRSSSFRQHSQVPPMHSQPQSNPAAKKALPQGPVAASYATPPPPHHHQATPPSPGHYAPRPHQPMQHVPPMGRPAPLPVPNAAANMPSSRSPSPGLPPTPGYTTNDPSRPPPPPGHHLHTPPHLRPQRSMDELNSPPRSVSFFIIHDKHDIYMTFLAYTPYGEWTSPWYSTSGIQQQALSSVSLESRVMVWCGRTMYC